MQSTVRAALSCVTAGGAELLQHWSWLVPASYLPLFATQFGDHFLRSPSGSIYFLNTMDAVVVEAAENQIDLFEQLQNEPLREEVLMPDLARDLAAKLRPLAEMECFSVNIPPTLGGKLESKNFHILSLSSHLAALGQIQAQIAGDKPGTKYMVRGA